jgi:cell division protein FtsQ
MHKEAPMPNKVDGPQRHTVLPSLYAQLAWVTVFFTVLWGLLQGGAWLWRHAPTVTQVQLQGPFVHASSDQISQALKPLLGQSMFDLHTAPIQKALRAMPWVAAVEMRKAWPHGVVVRVREKQAVVRWKAGFLTAQGLYFKPKASNTPGLPAVLLRGPDDDAPQVLAHYALWKKAVQPWGWTITQFQLTPSALWRMDFARGTQLLVRQAGADAALKGFLRSWPLLSKPKTMMAVRIDLRYPHGMAVQWEKKKKKA